MIQRGQVYQGVRMPTLHDCHEVINENFIRSGNQPKYVKSEFISTSSASFRDASLQHQSGPFSSQGPTLTGWSCTTRLVPEMSLCSPVCEASALKIPIVLQQGGILPGPKRRFARLKTLLILLPLCLSLCILPLDFNFLLQRQNPCHLK